MTLSDLQPNKPGTLRRSQRVCLSVPIQIVKSEPGKQQATEDTRTLIVSAHGALFVLQLPVQASELLILRHKKTQEQLVCRVVSSTPDQMGKFEVAVEFEHPAPKFWRIAFPPTDWTPRSPDAKTPSAQPPGRRPLVNRAATDHGDPDQGQPIKSRQAGNKPL